VSSFYSDRMIHAGFLQHRIDSEHNKKVVGFVKEEISSSSVDGNYSACDVKREYYRNNNNVLVTCITLCIMQDHLLSIGELYSEKTWMLQANQGRCVPESSV